METNLSIIEKLFSAEGITDSKHILNTSNKEVERTILDKIENEGVTIEQLNEFQKSGLHIYMYQTQITIHGLFPQLYNNYLSNYKTLFQNKNKSIGVKWNGIDNEKKRLIYKKLSYFGWNIRHTSNEWFVFKQKRVKDKAEALEFAEKFKNDIEKIDTTIFYGFKQVYYAKGMFGLYVIAEVGINGILEANINKLIEQATNKSIAEVEQVIADIDKQRADEQAEYLKQSAIRNKIEAEKRAEYERQKQEWANNNPIFGAVYVKDNPICEGQIYANPTPISNENWEWEFVAIKKIGANICHYKCDKSGKKLQKAVKCYSSKKSGYLLQQLKEQPRQTTMVNVTKAVKQELSDIKLVDYSDKAFAVIGDTKPIKETLKSLGGRFNMHLSCGAGWIFPKSKAQELKQAFNL